MYLSDSQARRAAAGEIIRLLALEYPDAACSLTYKKDYELLFAARMSAQCTDERVNLVTADLYQKYDTLAAFAEADITELENDIRSTGFFRIKARDIKAAAQMLISEFDGKVPGDMASLLRLPGVGRKTANLIIGDIFGGEGYVCDTHCIRITNLLGIASSDNPIIAERQLREVIPPEDSSAFCHRIVQHGRKVCIARRPRCADCVLREVCAYNVGRSHF